MENSKISEIARIFFQFGPFAILPYMIYAMTNLLKQIKMAADDVKELLKRQYTLYLVVTILLIVFCVGFWSYSILDKSAYYFGEIEGINPASLEVRSPHLYLRSYNSDNDFFVGWVWKKGKDDDYAKIKLIGNDPTSNSSTIREFFLIADQLKEKRKISITYSLDNGQLLFGSGQPLPKVLPKKIVDIPAAACTRPDITSSPFSLYAGSLDYPKLNIDKALNLLQALDLGARDQAVEYVIGFLRIDKNSVFLLLHKGLDMVFMNKGQKPVFQQNIMYNRDFLLASLLRIADASFSYLPQNYEEWKAFFTEPIVDMVVEEAGGEEPEIQRLSLAFLSRFTEEAANEISQKFTQASYKNNPRYLKGGIQFLAQIPSQNSYLREWANSGSFSHNPEVQVLLRSLVLEDRPVIDLNLLTGKKKEIIAMALELKKKNVPFKWGGKINESGLDSFGFIAYLLSRAGLLAQSDAWWLGNLKKEVGIPIKDVGLAEAGDLFFYTEGYVMIYLGENRVIGMTASGIVVMDFRKMPGKLLQVNRVDFSKKYVPPQETQKGK